MYLKDQLYMTTLYYEGSLTKAARQLNISQPAMSKWLMDLEHQLNQKLVVRSSSGIVFTKAGYIYLSGCRECLDAALEMRKELSALSQKISNQLSLEEARYEVHRPLLKFLHNFIISIRM